jgi:alkanesulfonate monooxygenase SsuD/methylene tetrahydromethanopterin reductase-like flavin-dependent oxidoreductase (luciferase family)
MVLATSLIGTKEMVGARLRAWKAVGIDQVRLYPAGSTLEERLSTLGQTLDLVAALESGP